MKERLKVTSELVKERFGFAVVYFWSALMLSRSCNCARFKGVTCCWNKLYEPAEWRSSRVAVARLWNGAAASVTCARPALPCPGSPAACPLQAKLSQSWAVFENRCMKPKRAGPEAWRDRAQRRGRRSGGRERGKERRWWERQASERPTGPISWVVSSPQSVGYQEATNVDGDPASVRSRSKRRLRAASRCVLDICAVLLWSVSGEFQSVVQSGVLLWHGVGDIGTCWRGPRQWNLWHMISHHVRQPRFQIAHVQPHRQPGHEPRVLAQEPEAPVCPSGRALHCVPAAGAASPPPPPAPSSGAAPPRAAPGAASAPAPGAAPRAAAPCAEGWAGWAGRAGIPGAARHPRHAQLQGGVPGNPVGPRTGCRGWQDPRPSSCSCPRERQWQEHHRWRQDLPTPLGQAEKQGTCCQGPHHHRTGAHSQWRSLLPTSWICSSSGIQISGPVGRSQRGRCTCSRMHATRCVCEVEARWGHAELFLLKLVLLLSQGSFRVCKALRLEAQVS